MYIWGRKEKEIHLKSNPYDYGYPNQNRQRF